MKNRKVYLNITLSMFVKFCVFWQHELKLGNGAETDVFEMLCQLI